MQKPAIDFEPVAYPCKLCGKFKGDHKAVTFHCPIKGTSRTFRSFNVSDQYEADMAKPRKLGWQI